MLHAWIFLFTSVFVTVHHSYKKLMHDLTMKLNDASSPFKEHCLNVNVANLQRALISFIYLLFFMSTKKVYDLAMKMQ